jgi:hypothetical protein
MPIDFKKVLEDGRKVCLTCGGKKMDHCWMWDSYANDFKHIGRGKGVRLDEKPNGLIHRNRVICRKFTEETHASSQESTHG